MLLVGILLGPFGLNLLDEKLLAVSPELRQIALMIILLRAGLALDLSDLKAVGRPAVLMCFVPACFEILGTVAAAPRLPGAFADGSGAAGKCDGDSGDRAVGGDSHRHPCAAAAGDGSGTRSLRGRQTGCRHRRIE